VSPVKYELGFYIPEDGILHSDSRENLKSYNIEIFLEGSAGKDDKDIDKVACFTDHRQKKSARC
jgi:hypothetical protein